VFEILLQFARDWNDLGVVGLTLFAGMFALGSIILVPRTVLCLVGGFIFGFAAFPVAVVATTVGATVALLISRYLLRPRFLRLIEDRPKFQTVAHAVDVEGWRIIVLSRLASPIPNPVYNYLLGLSNISVWTFTWATVLGSIIPIFAYVCIGAMSQVIVEPYPMSPVQKIVMGVGALNSLLVIWLIARRTKRSPSWGAISKPRAGC
jgi:uncharacterized membrane protein YdjX (TVP38/TMEM64 family)